MAIPASKSELIFAIKDSYSKLKIDLDSIPSRVTTEKNLEAHVKGTNMSICDLVAYLIGWGELVKKWNRKKDNGEKADFPETGYKWNELGKLAQKFYSDYNQYEYNNLLEKLDEVVDEILHLTENTNNMDLYEKPWYNKWTKGRMIQLNTASPYKNARKRIRKWIKETGSL